MKFGPVPLAEAEGKILGHNVAGGDGKRRLRKGKPLRAEDVSVLLLMLAYLNDIPILGAPGCARSRKTNVIDWVLPRLLAGDHLTREDIMRLGPGGLLEDVPERPLPRSRLES